MNDAFDSIDAELLIRFLAKEADDFEQQEVMRWLNSNKNNKQYFNELSLLWEASANADTFNDKHLVNDWAIVRTKIEALKRSESLQSTRQRNFIPNLARIAASIALIVGFYFIGIHLHKHFFPKMLIASSGATVSMVSLSDGTIVHLNANSKLTYPEKFLNEQRKVTLEGEGFFEVAKDATRPFMVETKTIEAEVLGTSFNVNGGVENASVTVFTGTVRVQKEREVLILTKGEQALYEGGALTKTSDYSPNVLSWKTKVLTFANTPITEVVKDLEVYFNQPITIPPHSLDGCRWSSAFKNSTLDEVLKELVIVFGVQIERKAGTIVIHGKGC